MKYVVYVLGLMWIAAGSCLILYTESSKEWAKRLFTQMDPKKLALLPGVFGLLLIISSGSTGHAVFVGVIGILSLAKALLIFFNPGGLYSSIVGRYPENISDQAHRLSGIIGLILGTVIISWII